MRLEKKTEKPIHPHAITAILGVGFLSAGYGLALDIMRGKQSLWNTIGFSPIAMLTLLCVVAGTILFMYSFLPYVCQKIRQKKSRLYHEDTIIVVPKFMHRIRSNAKSLILLILLTAGTLAVFGSTVLSMWYPYQSFRRIIPSAIEYRVTNEQEKEISLQALQEACDEQEYEVYETIIFKVKATSDRLPTEYSISKDKGRIPGFECISRTDYATLLSQQGKKTDIPELSDTDCILIKDYEIMLKMGYSHTMIKKCVRRQIQIYYGIPYVIGSLHSIFAMICYKSALMDDLLGRNSAVVAPILLAVAIFSIIYAIYYQLTKRSCYKIALI